MHDMNNACRHLIIGGTIKGGTSSLFAYLSAHPEACGSSVKETFFFTHEYSGQSDHDRERYGRYFSPRPGAKVCVEASPNYLGYKENVAPRIKVLLPDAKLVFVLRNPADRLYSYYNFAVGKLELPADLGFERYVDLCERYASGRLSPEQAGIAEKHLRALEIGGYAGYLKNFYDVFPPQQIEVAFFDQLARDPVRFMSELCRFAGLDPEFFRNFGFGKANVTFSSRLKLLHRIAMLLNRALESVLRRHPGMKARLVRMYKRFNQDREGYRAMTETMRARLAQYYAPANRELRQLLQGRELPAWLDKRPDGSS
jgi:hypothetical protein